MQDENKNQINIKDISGNVIVSEYQSGGITAHTLNVTSGLNKRILTSKIKSIIEELKNKPVVAYRLHYSQGDDEVNALANEIDQILSNSSWKKIAPIQRLAGPNLPKGITIFMLKPEEPIITLSNLLWETLGGQGVEGQVLTDVHNVFTFYGTHMYIRIMIILYSILNIPNILVLDSLAFSRMKNSVHPCIDGQYIE